LIPFLEEERGGRVRVMVRVRVRVRGSPYVNFRPPYPLKGAHPPTSIVQHIYKSKHLPSSTPSFNIQRNTTHLPIHSPHPIISHPVHALERHINCLLQRRYFGTLKAKPNLNQSQGLNNNLHCWV
jgi:hypothetical protein